jgi:hypothetical protein
MCPSCGLLVGADSKACQCGYTLSSIDEPGSAAARVREIVDLFSAREALSIALQAVSEMRGGLMRWMAIIGAMQLLPMVLVGPKADTPRDVAVLFFCAVVAGWVGYGLARAALRSLRGEGLSLSKAWLSPATYGGIILALLVITVPVIIGLLLFIAPGIYLALTWSQISFLILDGKARHVDALRISEDLTRHRRFEIFVALLVPALLQLPAVVIQTVVPPGGSVLTPGFMLFMVSALWQMLVGTYSIWVGAVVYQVLLNNKRHRPVA